ncbi:hypothetical protein ABZ297_04000 [Nonomuraea sp. NPDC005983]
MRRIVARVVAVVLALAAVAVGGAGWYYSGVVINRRGTLRPGDFVARVGR